MKRPDDPEVLAWLAKAGEDLRAASVLAEHAAYLDDIIAFHCQQAVEKLLKALYVSLDREAPRAHDVDRLVAGLLASGRTLRHGPASCNPHLAPW